MCKVSYLFIISLCFFACNEQSNIQFDNSISFPETGKILSAKELKQIIIDSSANYIIEYRIKSNKGEMEFERRKKNGGLIETGYYKEANKLLVDTFSKENPENPIEFIQVVSKYYEPQKAGVWKYYDESGKVIREEKWKDGVLINN